VNEVYSLFCLVHLPFCLIHESVFSWYLFLTFIAMVDFDVCFMVSEKLIIPSPYFPGLGKYDVIRI